MYDMLIKIMAISKKSSKLSNLIMPAMVGVIIVVAFMVGVLWQKVSYLEKYGVRALGETAQNPSAGENILASVKASDLNIPEVTEKDHIKGTGKLTWIEYSDLECPFCKRIHSDLQKLVEEYDGQIAWVYRHYPIESLHPKALKEAEAAECAAELGGNDKFWAFVDRLFEITPANNGLDPKQLPQIAGDVGLSKSAFQTCLDSGRHAATVQSQYEGGTKAGVTGTPGNFLLDDKGNAWVISGAQPYTTIKQIVETALKNI